MAHPGKIGIKVIFRLICISVIMIVAVSSLALFSNTKVGEKSLLGQSLEEELEQVKKDREETQKKIQEAKKVEQAALSEVKVVEEELLTSLSQLDTLNDKLAKAKKDVDDTTIDLVMKEDELRKIDDELNKKVAILNERVASIYKSNNNNILEILLKAEDFIEFVSRLKLMNILAQQDARYR